jgi:transcriptional regulator with XRE-family HTH domain
MGTIIRGLIVLFFGLTCAMAEGVLRELGVRIRAKRKSLGWSQEMLAFMAGIDRSYVGGVERGERNVTFTVLCRLVTALKCDVADVTRGLPPRSSAQPSNPIDQDD